MFRPAPGRIRRDMEASMGEALNTHEVARATGLSYSTLRKMRIQGRGPRFVKLGHAVRYPATEVSDWLDARKVSSTSERVPA